MNFIGYKIMHIFLLLELAPLLSPARWNNNNGYLLAIYLSSLCVEALHVLASEGGWRLSQFQRQQQSLVVFTLSNSMTSTKPNEKVCSSLNLNLWKGPFYKKSVHSYYMNCYIFSLLHTNNEKDSATVTLGIDNYCNPPPPHDEHSSMVFFSANF